ncbi:helix-turn-helix domain-containing protein [Paracoccus sp. IB05]|uniref:helix-turn-helix domain-containing protein n=1 Tax=Paracoccus sp. IB05 TaxID=2779367 RepID=UPI0018E81157|nr:helix-turn-helix domain-containing protein [Paracoccus sp. IB05]MBJ2149987.1 helix-turn-helix domain-containing protein [Paracoccus sp. IB05]
MPEKLMITEQAAQYLQCSEAFFTRDRWQAKQAGTAPQIPFVKIGKFVRYRLSDLEAIAAGA